MIFIQPEPISAVALIHEQLDKPEAKLHRTGPINEATRKHCVSLRSGPITVNLLDDGSWTCIAGVRLES